MPNQFLSDEFGDIEDYFVTDYRLIDNFVGDSLWVWGTNESFSLGINQGNVIRSTPVTTFAGGTNWKYISSGGYHNAAIKTDGSLWVWGDGGSGRLGTNDTTSRSTPVTTFAGGNNWKQVAASGGYTLAIKTDGSLWGWGIQQDGVLGNGEQYGSVNVPVNPSGGGNNWKSASAGSPSAAIKTDGSLWVFGSNNNGQLGINVNGGLKVTPVTTFAGGNDWKQVSCGSEYVAAIKTDGSLWTWGRGTEGQLGNFSNTNRSTPVTTFAGGNDWKSVACGNQYTMAIKTDGSLWGWGSNGAGKLGANLADTDQRSTPVTTFAGGNNWKQVSCGQNHTQAIKTDGSLWVWGGQFDGRLGNNVVGFSFALTPFTTFAGGNNWKQASAANRHGSAIKSGLNVDLS
jgi:alpha-tubulin suppressor-like RCC1 family protein